MKRRPTPTPIPAAAPVERVGDFEAGTDVTVATVVCVPTLKVMAVAVPVVACEARVVVVETVVLYAPSLIAAIDENCQCCAGCRGVASVSDDMNRGFPGWQSIL